MVCTADLADVSGVSGVVAENRVLADIVGLRGDDGGVVCGVRGGDAEVWGGVALNARVCFYYWFC